MSICVGIFVAFAAESLMTGAIIGAILIGISYAIYHFIPLFSDSESIPYSILAQTCGPVFKWLAIASIAPAVIRLIMYFINRTALNRSSYAKNKYDNAKQKWGDFCDAQRDEMVHPYKGYVDDKYLKDLSELDKINE